MAGSNISTAEGSTGYRAAKVVFICGNLLFLLMGVAVVVMGFYVKVGQEDFLRLFDQAEFDIATALLISAGVIVTMAALIGFVGLFWQNEVILVFYLILVVAVFALEITAGTLGYTNRDKVDAEIGGNLQRSIRNPTLRKYWDNVQQENRCCGVNNYTDWQGVADPSFKRVIPDSCCQVSYRTCGEAGGASVAFKDGCYMEVRDFLFRDDTIQLIAIGGIIVGVLQILLIILAVVVIVYQRRHIKKQNAQYNQFHNTYTN